VERSLERGRALLPTSATLWPRLVELFGIIAEGSPPLKVATFDGGLFDAERHPFLESYVVGDGHLQRAIDRLARVDGQFVDYRDLAERHLGTIYEGLLEYYLEALAEPEEGWTVELLNDRGERKATGSYYTPDYVVEYIVEATVEPMLHEAVEGTKSDKERVEAVLALNVLDPSMGSGHFLVEVTERISRFLVELGVAPEEIEADGEAELAYWKRRVAQSCVYGVDANPLAVDLAKLSLWLATVAKDRPLSFLDHHLRTGDSLVGARIAGLQPAGHKKQRKKAEGNDAAQLSMLEDDAFLRSVSNAVGSIWLIEESPPTRWRRCASKVPRVAGTVDPRAQVERRPCLALGRRRGSRRDLPPDLPLTPRAHEATRSEAPQTPRQGPLLVGAPLLRLLRRLREAEDPLSRHNLAKQLLCRHRDTDFQQYGLLPIYRYRVAHSCPQLPVDVVLLLAECSSRQRRSITVL